MDLDRHQPVPSVHFFGPFDSWQAMKHLLKFTLLFAELFCFAELVLLLTESGFRCNRWGEEGISSFPNTPMAMTMHRMMAMPISSP
jgi:hypothetical protein